MNVIEALIEKKAKGKTIINLTKKQAAELLDFWGTPARPANPKHVEKLRTKMDRGAWLTDGTDENGHPFNPILVDVTGDNPQYDGYHRLHAFVKSDLQSLDFVFLINY